MLRRRPPTPALLATPADAETLPGISAPFPNLFDPASEAAAPA